MTPPRPTRAVCYASVFSIELQKKIAWLRITDTEVGAPEGVAFIGAALRIDWKEIGEVSANDRLGVTRFTSGTPSVTPLKKGDNILLQVEIVGTAWKPVSWCYQKDVTPEIRPEEVNFKFATENGQEFLGTPDSIRDQMISIGLPEDTQGWPAGTWMMYDPSKLDFSHCSHEPSFPSVEENMGLPVADRRKRAA